MLKRTVQALTTIPLLKRCGALAKAVAKRTRLDAFRAEDGATAVEFALVAAPFFALIVAILELVVLFFAESELDAATEQAARLVLTGQASSASQSQFQLDVCGFLPAMFTCSNVLVDLTSVSSYSSANTSTPSLTYDAQGHVTNSWSYQPGGTGSIEVLRVMYQWPVFPGPLNLNFANLSNGNFLMMSTAVFRNEPT